MMDNTFDELSCRIHDDSASDLPIAAVTVTPFTEQGEEVTEVVRNALEDHFGP